MKKKVYTFFMDEKLIDVLKAYAEDTDTSASRVIRVAIREYMKNHPVEGDG